MGETVGLSKRAPLAPHTGWGGCGGLGDAIKPGERADSVCAGSGVAPPALPRQPTIAAPPLMDAGGLTDP